MFRLKAFGGLALEGAEPLGAAATQRKSLALLALLASAGDRAISRDKLLAYLWREAEPERASHRLAQMIYALRRDLDADSLFLGSCDLRLNPNVITSDLADFSRALACGDRAAAAVTYVGPFLDGFYLSGAPEFERWAEAERGHLASRYRESVEALAGEAVRRGDRAAAAQWWRRLAEADPLSSQVAVGLMQALAAAGDRAGALSFARVHEELVRAEFEADPSPAIVALVDQLRAARRSPAGAIASPQPPRQDTPPVAKPPGFGEVPPADRYVIEREIGRGGMATMYLARDVRHDRPVALKVVRPEVAAELGAERFAREIRTVAQLHHPHILPLYDSGELDQSGTPSGLYYVMPYIAGESLRQRLRRDGRLTIEAALRVAREVADALTYAHRRGIVHRDIKPENILLDEDHALVTDFGVARAYARAAPAARGDQLTGAGMSIGTPAYMSPEQMSGAAEIDGRSDIYSLACVVFEMLTGEAPFPGPRSRAVLARRVTERPRRVRELRPEVPSTIDDAVARAMAQMPAERFGTAAEFTRALGAESDVTPRSSATPPPAPSELPSIAVLPFANLSPDSDNEYFSDGMTDELINALAQVKGLRVAARTSTFALKGKGADAREIGERLRVRTLLEGSVRRAGDRIRMAVQLVDAAEGYQIWSQTYERTLADVFAVQDEIARAIVMALLRAVPASPATPLVKPPTAALEAYSVYLRGLYFANRRTAESFQASIPFYEQAIAVDPAFAPAHAALAYSWAMLGLETFGAIAGREAAPRAKAAGLRAVDLDVGLAEAHAALGIVAFLFEYDRPTAEREFERAIALRPTWSVVHLWYSLFLSSLGRHDESLDVIARAREADPLSLGVHLTVGRSLIFARRFEEAIAQCLTTLEMEPHYVPALADLGRSLRLAGRPEEAVAELERSTAAVGRAPLLLHYLGQAYAVVGRTTEARTILEELRALARRRYVSAIHEAAVLHRLGDLDAAFGQYEIAYEQRSAFLAFIDAEPDWDGLRSDPRYLPLARRLGSSAAGAAPAV